MLWRMTVNVPAFVHLTLWRKGKEDFMGVDKARQGLDYRIVNKIMCSLEDSQILFQKPVNLDAQTDLVLKNFYAWGMTTHHDLPSLPQGEFMIR